jgi:hypothetical protein
MATSTFGNIAPPLNNAYFTSSDGSGLFLFLSNIFKLAGTLAGLYFVVQIILAGYKYISANGDEKRTAMAWATIWQSVIGIFIIGSAFVLASVIGTLLGIDILNPTIQGPGQTQSAIPYL